MYKKLSLVFLIAIIPVLSFANLANQAAVNKQQNKSLTNTQKTKPLLNQVILLRAKPSNTSKVIGRYQPDAGLVGFYQRGDWYKAGDPKTGQVGWYNIKQYNSVINRVNQPKVNSFALEVSQEPKGPVKIIAYKDGKMITQKQAKAIYHKFRKQLNLEQQQWQQQMQVFQQQVNNFQQQVNSMMKNGAPLLMMPQPIIIIQQPPQSTADQNQQPHQATALNPNKKIKQLNQAK